MSATWRTVALPGGLPLLLQERGGPDLLAARLWIRGGSSADGPGQRGLHQLLAGVMTRGCGSLDAEALADLVEGRGASLRAEAGEDALVVSLKCAAEHSSELLPLLIAMAREPHLATEQVDLERELNLQMLQRQREDPFQLAHDQLRQLLYGEGPYGHDPLGVEGELARITTDQLRGAASQLGRSGAVLVLCGAVELESWQPLSALLEAAPWPVPPLGQSAGPAANGPQGCALLEQDTEQLVLMLGVGTVPLGHPDALGLRLLQAHLGLGMSSRLFQVMREQHALAYDVGVHLPARCGATPLVWHLSSSAENAAQACRALLEEWQRVLEQPLRPEELELARAKFLGQDAMGRQTCGQIADRQALVLGHGLPHTFVGDCLQRAGELTAADLLAVAQRRLQQPSLSLCGPASAVEEAQAIWLQHPLSRQSPVAFRSP